MLTKLLKASPKFYGWLSILLAIMGVGLVMWLYQLREGLGVTGMSRDVSWGLYIAQFTFMVGVAASAVMVVLPYYLHNFKKFGKITVLGEFLAVSSVLMCQLFIFADMGMPTRVANIVLYPTLNSVMFFDMIVLTGYLLLNLVISWVVLSSERMQKAPPKWTKVLIYISIPWAVSIHTVTAFLYAGLPGRHLWLTAILAARFLSSAFAAGPAFLILMCMLIRNVSKFDPGKEAIQKLAQVATYAMIMNVFFLGLEIFTAFYSGIPSHRHSLQYLYMGLNGGENLVPWMWISGLLSIGSIIMLVIPSIRHNEKTLAAALIMLFIGAWIDKGVGLIIGGFIPNPFERVVEYSPTAVEMLITAAIYATGFFVLSVLYRIAIGVREELDVV